MKQYSKATDEMIERTERIATANHERLRGRKIAVIMQDEADNRKGKLTLGWASLPSNRLRPLLNDDYDFVICFARKEWDRMDNSQKDAVVDHELCHCGIDDNLKPYLKDHDYEEFALVFQRHGYWRKNTMERAFQQMALLSISNEFSSDSRQVHVGTLAK